ncbi:MAG: hypothetical protein KC550_06105 [Nanoarchaeota archaeon]|nr:hypothetical protein [Nanoarchaeota archaeon]
MKKRIQILGLSLLIAGNTTIQANENENYSNYLKNSIEELIAEIWLNSTSSTRASNSTNHIYRNKIYTVEYHDFANDGFGTGDFLSIGFNDSKPITLTYFINRNKNIHSSINSEEFPYQFRSIETDWADLETINNLTLELKNQYLPPKKLSKLK